MRYRNFFVVLILIALSSCTVQKRYAMSGYYFDWNHLAKNVKPEKHRHVDRLVSINQLHIKTLNNPVNLFQLIPSKYKNVTTVPITRASHKSLSKTRVVEETATSSGCDTIHMRDGLVVIAMVLEITPDQLSYRNCDNSEGLKITVEKSKIGSITYANGSSEKFDADRSPQSIVTQKTNGLAITSFVLGIVSLLVTVLGPAAIITGTMALKEIKKNPTLYKGDGYAKAGVTMGIISTILLVIGLLLLLVLMLLITTL